MFSTLIADLLPFPNQVCILHETSLKETSNYHVWQPWHDSWSNLVPLLALERFYVIHSCKAHGLNWVETNLNSSRGNVVDHFKVSSLVDGACISNPHGFPFITPEGEPLYVYFVTNDANVSITSMHDVRRWIPMAKLLSLYGDYPCSIATGSAYARVRQRDCPYRYSSVWIKKICWKSF